MERPSLESGDLDSLGTNVIFSRMAVTPSKSFTQIQPRTGVPLFQQAAGSILSYVRSARLKADHMIPTPKQIGAHLGINELTVRRGLQLLIQQQLLYSVKGKGTFVTSEAVSRTVLLLVGLTDLNMSTNDYFPTLFRALGKRLAVEDIHLEAICCSHGDEHKIKRLCSEVSVLRYEGIVFTACNSDHPVLRYMQNNNHNYVWRSRQTVPNCGVANSVSNAQKIALRFLKEGGHSKIDVLSCVNSVDIEKELSSKLDALRKDIDLQEVALHTVCEQHERCNDLERGGYELMLRLLKENTLPQAYLFTNNLIARGASRALLSAGIQLNEKNCVLITTEEQHLPLGFPITLVCRSIAEEAELTVEMLLERLKEDIIPATRQLKCRLIPSRELELSSCSYLSEDEG